MKLLLHGCCADCTLKFVESIKEEGTLKQFAVYYYNPNIHPRSEYHSRLKAMQLMIQDKVVKLIIPDWKPSDYFLVQANNKKPERCLRCWSLRLENTAKFAKENGYTHFSSTLVTSQYQDSEKVIEIGKAMAQKYGLKFLTPKSICTDLKTKGFYKQIFCGCCYSLTERFEEKFIQNNGEDN